MSLSKKMTMAEKNELYCHGGDKEAARKHPEMAKRRSGFSAFMGGIKNVFGGGKKKGKDEMALLPKGHSGTETITSPKNDKTQRKIVPEENFIRH